MQLSTLAIGLGAALAVPHIYGLAKPAAAAAAIRKFPRSLAWGYVLMAIGTAWFLWNLSSETISDFASYKKLMLIGFGAVGLLTCVYVKDFLAVRGLAIVMLLTAKVMLDTARWHSSSWHLLISVLAYGWILAGMWFTISPWRLRDLIDWSTADLKRVRIISAFRLGLGLLILILGVTVFQ